MMRTSLVLAAAVCLAGCGQAPEKSGAAKTAPAKTAGGAELTLVTFDIPAMT